MSMDPLDIFLHEKVADAAPGPSIQADRGVTASPDPGSLDPGERAVAGLAAVSGSIAAKALPFVSNVALRPMAEAGSVPAFSPEIRTKKLLGLFNISDRPRPDLEIHQAIFRKKLKEIEGVVDSFMNKHRIVERGVKMEIASGPLSRAVGPFYSTARKTVHLPIVGKEVILHELGHAADYTAGRLGRIRRIAEPILQRGVLAALPIAMIAGDRIKEILPGTVDDKAIEFMQNHAPEIMGATLAATSLYPEAKASGLALKHIAQTEGSAAARKALSRLAPAFGSYLLGAIPAVVGMALARKYMRNARAEKGSSDALTEDRMRELEKTSGLMRDALSWSREFGKDLHHIGRQIGEQTVGLVRQPGTLRRIGSAAKEVGTSPEFVMGSISSAIPATVGALYLYGTPSGRAVRQRISPEHREIVATGKRKGVMFAKSKDEAWRERHPLRYAGLVAAGAALSGGILSKFFSDLLKIV